MLMNNKSYMLITVLLCFSTTLFAQQTGKKQEKFKPPVVHTILGIRSNGDTVTKDEATQLIGLPLKVTDEKKVAYKIITYQFLYRRKGYLENPETGKVETSFSVVSQRFDNTPLTKVWINNIRTDLKAQEEFYFFDVIVQDKLGRNFFAPSLKLIIE